jgi:hypothetical protein
MKIEQSTWTEARGWSPTLWGTLGQSADLVLVFGTTAILEKEGILQEIRNRYLGAFILGCSTAGEISGVQVSDDSCVATAVSFEHTELKGSSIRLGQGKDSFEAGTALAKSLEPAGLVHVLVLSDGLGVNGSELVRGLTRNLPDSVTVTGGLAADGDRFKKTLVFWNAAPETGTISILGLYGNRLKVGCGSLGGWDPFGPERLITRSRGNILYEFDGRSALELYKRYLGEHAAGLPASGLLYPLSLRTDQGETGVVRTILSVNEDDQSMTFAGDVPEGSYARLMKANFDRLIDGAMGAARISRTAAGADSPDLAILISCVGRKLVLRQRIEEEVEGVRQILGERTALTGFYSYGEICPFTPGSKCELHNQTMTITTFSEQ